MILYHVSTESLIEGQILEPGKFWKGMKEEFNPNNLVIKIELIFESIMEKIYPFQVSRSNCVFACKEIENAKLMAIHPFVRSISSVLDTLCMTVQEK